MKWAKQISISMQAMLQQGTTPEKVALSVALGGTLGVFPVPGVSTVMCVMLAVVLRLNHAMIQVFNYAAYPLQILLLGGYVALGNHWFGSSGSVENFSSMASLMQHDLWQGLLAVKGIALSASLVWLVTSPLLAVAVYCVARFAAVKIQGALNHPDGAADRRLKTKYSARTRPRGGKQVQTGMTDEMWHPPEVLDCATCPT